MSAAGVVSLLGAVGIFVHGSTGEAPLTATVTRGPFTVTLTEAGTLRAAASATFRSPLEGREVEIAYLAPEGSEVNEGDLLVRVDATAVRVELERATQSVREIEMELQAAQVDRDEASVAVRSATDGAGTIAVDEARTNLSLLRAKANRLRDDHDRLQPLLAKGYITREEYERSALELDEADARAALAERALQVLVERTRPAEEQTARLQLARRHAQLEHLRPKLDAARAYERTLVTLLEGCTIRAPRPGLVVYEENLASAPRRKVRVGDRVTPAQPVVTLPDLRQMVVETSIREADVRLATPGQTTRIRVDAFPELTLTGRLARVGALAQSHGSSEARFAVVIEVNRADTTLRPGMNVRVDVVVAERGDALTVPVAAVFAEAGASVCYVARRWAFERRVVTLGRSNGTQIEILSGLREGERVSLVAPAVHAP